MLHQLNRILKIPRIPGQPVQISHTRRLDHPSPQVAQHPLPHGRITRHATVPSGNTTRFFLYAEVSFSSYTGPGTPPAAVIYAVSSSSCRPTPFASCSVSSEIRV